MLTDEEDVESALAVLGENSFGGFEEDDPAGSCVEVV